MENKKIEIDTECLHDAWALFYRHVALEYEQVETKDMLMQIIKFSLNGLEEIGVPKNEIKDFLDKFLIDTQVSKNDEV